ncbi:MAG: metallophosphoesterase [Candidatus Bathyarchaeia archaeon]
MVLAGLISDTHDNLTAIDKAVKLFNRRSVKLVIHAGDWCAPFAMLRFKELKCSLVGVYGNVDGEREKLKERAVELGFKLDTFEEFNLDGLNCAVLHGVDERIVKALALSGLYRVLVRGHTHKTTLERIGECIVVNPGEACGYLTGRKTAAILDSETLNIEIVDL